MMPKARVLHWSIGLVVALLSAALFLRVPSFRALVIFLLPTGFQKDDLAFLLVAGLVLGGYVVTTSIRDRQRAARLRESNAKQARLLRERITHLLDLFDGWVKGAAPEQSLLYQLNPTPPTLAGVRSVRRILREATEALAALEQLPEAELVPALGQIYDLLVGYPAPPVTFLELHDRLENWTPLGASEIPEAQQLRRLRHGYENDWSLGDFQSTLNTGTPRTPLRGALGYLTTGLGEG